MCRMMHAQKIALAQFLNNKTKKRSENEVLLLSRNFTHFFSHSIYARDFPFFKFKSVTSKENKEKNNSFDKIRDATCVWHS